MLLAIDDVRHLLSIVLKKIMNVDYKQFTILFIFIICELINHISLQLIFKINSLLF